MADETKPIREPTDDGTVAVTEVPVCPTCLSELAPNSDFCVNCGMPLSCLATMDPLKGVYAQGWAYRHAVSGRSSRLVVAGMWLIFLPVAYCYVRYARSWLLSDPYGKDPNHTWIAILYLAFTVPLILLCGAILMRATLNYIYQARVERGICIKCGHDLHEATEPRCPECGTGFARPEPEE